MSKCSTEIVIGMDQSDKKSDRRDAEMLAEIARFDTELFYPISHRSLES